MIKPPVNIDENACFVRGFKVATYLEFRLVTTTASVTVAAHPQRIGLLKRTSENEPGTIVQFGRAAAMLELHGREPRRN